MVDDSSLRRAIVSRVLGERFEVVGEAESGREAVELFGAEDPDLVTELLETATALLGSRFRGVAE